MASRKAISPSHSSHPEPQTAFNTVVSILHKAAPNRKQDDLNTLVPLLQQIEFFKSRKLKLADFKAIAQCLTYECYQSGETVIEYGTYGTKFYVILKGSVGVFVPWSTPELQGVRKKSKVREGTGQAHDSDENEEDTQPIFKEVAILQDGKSFGELALITCKPR